MAVPTNSFILLIKGRSKTAIAVKFGKQTNSIRQIASIRPRLTIPIGPSHN